ncbi:MAG TPA: hypothetical protein DEB09_00225 [Candidatus Magasanikbacteria bacterium]|nr:hypothetical protein [Candidatus Magasanikbacteria bacterium]
MKKISYNKLSEQEKNLLEQARGAGNQYWNKKGTRHVGAALLCVDGKIYQGTSIRRTNVSNSTCAERMALDKAIFDKNYNYKIIAIVGFYDGKMENEVISPCGLCRQILSEAENYSGKNKKINLLLANENVSKIIKTDSQELFPISYQAKSYE